VGLYKSLVEKLMPLLKLSDRFHVMKQVNNELDAERKTTKKKREVVRQIKNKLNLSRF